MNKKVLIQLVLLVLVFRILYFGISYTADSFLRYAPTFAYGQDRLSQYGMDRWLYSWGNFDGVHYLTIVEKGYLGTGLIQAFFPLYPIFAWIINVPIQNTIASSLIVSNGATITALILLFLLTKKAFSTAVAWYTVGALLVFPTSFFLFATYSESLFLTFVLATFWFYSQKRWALMSICIAAASATRLVGVFLVPAILFEIIFENKFSFPTFNQIKNNCHKHFKSICFTLVGSVGLLLYMAYLWKTFGDPIYFWHVQEEFGGGREEKIILLPQTIWRYIKIFMTVPFNLRWFIYVEEMFFGVIPLCIVAYFWLKKRLISHSWALFSIFALVLPTVTGTFSSMPRYALVAFPLYVFLGIAYNRYPKLRWLMVLSVLVLLFNTVLFIQGYWVA